MSLMDLETNQPGVLPKRWAAPFFTIWTGQAFSLLGSQLVQFALVWYLTEQTGSATVLSMATLFALLPQVLLSPFAGALVDRWNRRLVMMMADTAVALTTLILGLLFLTGQVQVWHIFIAMLLRSAGGAFHWPAMQASTALMVPKEQLGRVNGLNQTLMGLMAIAAPSLGALLLKFFPIQGVMWIDVGTAAIAVAPLFFIAVPQPVKNAGQVGPEQKTSMWSDLREGLRYVGSWRGMLMIMVFAAILNFVLVPTFSLIALLVTQHFRGDVVQLGAINSAEGFGMLAGGLLLSAWGGFKKRIVTTMGGLLILGVAILTVGIAPSNFFWLAVAGMALAGVATPIINGPLFAVVQTVVEPDKLGRVMSLLNATSSAMAPLSLAIAGPLSDLIGIRTWYIVGGITCLIMGFSGYFIKSIMTIEEQKHDTAQAIE